MDYPTYPKEVNQLLGTFELKTYPITTVEKLGEVRFYVNNVYYSLTLNELCKAYGFKSTLNNKVKFIKEKDKLVWDIIGKGDYVPGASKVATIGNPALRYCHKLLAHTLFARKETDIVKDEEVALLTNGLKPLFEEEFANKEIEGYEYVNLGVLLARKLLYLRKNWVLRERTEPGRIYIGGFLTPLLLACGVPLSKPTPPLYLDMHHLTKTLFLSGKDGNKMVYTFETLNEEEAWVHLPNQSITKIDSLENVKFLSGERAIVGEDVEPMPLGRRKKSRRPQGESSTQNLPLGSSRYDHPRFEGRVQSGATKHALEGVEKNQRRGKWQSRAIHNLKKGFKKRISGLEDTISGMSETISGLKAIVEKFVLRKHSPPRYEDGSSSYGLALEDARRKSTSHLPSQSFQNDEEPSRASSYEHRAPRRKRRHIPTPSPPSSDNASFHLSDSYSEEE